MANFQRRGINKRLRIFYYCHIKKHAVQLPYKTYAHLQKASDSEIRKWIEEWEAQNGQRGHSVRKYSFRADRKLDKWLNDFLEFKRFKRQKGYREITLIQNKEEFIRLIAPFFITEKGATTDFKRWGKHVIEFHEHLRAINISPKRSKTILNLLRLFSEFLTFKGILESAWVVFPPTGSKESLTPLKVFRTPQDILHLLPKIERTELKLACLLGYFASLRPSESFGLCKSDFLTGRKATDCKSYEKLQPYGAGSQLTVIVEKTLQDPKKGGRVDLTKSKASRGLVNIFNQRAAAEIATIVKELPAGPLFKYSRSYLNHLWERYGKSVTGLTLHDLRRSSCLWLGKTLKMHPMDLKRYARHEEIETTMLYLRDPEEDHTLSREEPDFDLIISSVE